MTAGFVRRVGPGTRRALSHVLVAAVAVGLTAALVRSKRVLVPVPGRTAVAPASDQATRDYLLTLDVRRFERQGTDYTNPVYSPDRLGRPLGELDRVYDYDFPRVDAVVRRLAGVDRRAALRAVFERVTAGLRTNTERHLALLKFLHKAGNHNDYIQPIRPDRTGVFDPLVLLELGEMRCGQVNRLAVDLFRAAGFDGRLVQVACHVSAEVFYDGKWHHFDGSIWGNGEAVRDPDGTIPSVAELSRTPDRLDGLTAYWEPDHRNAIRLESRPSHPSWGFFAAEAYTASGVEPSFHVKTATPEQEAGSRDYGWEYWVQVPDPDRKLWPGLPRRPLPWPPLVQRCDVASAESGGGVTVALEWRPDPVASGFVVSVGRRPRGWNFDTPDGLPEGLRHLKSSTRGWRPDDYEARFTAPPAEVARVDTPDPRARLDLPADGGPYYVTVMAYDAHSRAAGRQVFPMSEELKISP